jgi:hypothetical protein
MHAPFQFIEWRDHTGDLAVLALRPHRFLHPAPMHILAEQRGDNDRGVPAIDTALEAERLGFHHLPLLVCIEE